MFVRYRTFVKAVQRVRENQPVVPHQERVSSQELPIAREIEILNYFDRNPSFSLRRAANHFQVSDFKVHKVLKQNKRSPFKYTKVQALIA